MQQNGVSFPESGKSPLIVSYYTPGTAYETHAMALRRNIRRFGLAARIEPLPSRGSWVENCAQKAEFIRDMHRAERRPLLWLDADARLRRPLRVLDGITADLAVVRLEGWAFYTGQIYFGAGPAASRLIDIWCDLCVRFPSVWDQVSLGYAWWELSLREPVSTLWLDEGLYRRESRRAVVRLGQRLFSRRAILQRQESRRSKLSQGIADRPEFGTDDVPLWWRVAAAANAPFPLSEGQLGVLGLG